MNETGPNTDIATQSCAQTIFYMRRGKVIQWNLSITALRIIDTSVIRTVDQGLEWSAIETCIYLTSELKTPLYSVKLTDFAVLLVPRLYKIHSILRTLAGLSHKIVQHRRLIHQLDVILTKKMVRIVLASGYPFLPSYGKGELWNVPSKCLTRRVRIATPTGNIPETSKVGTPL